MISAETVHIDASLIQANVSMDALVSRHLDAVEAQQIAILWLWTTTKNAQHGHRWGYTRQEAESEREFYGRVPSRQGR